jgi:Carboxypeptidase regulatory-like domain
LQDNQCKESGTQAECCQTGVLSGLVTIGPLSPVGGAKESRPPAPYAGAELVISQTAGNRTETAVTGQNGTYRIALPAGTYRVTLAALPDGQFTKDLPASVAIRQGEETRLNVHVDTGIR